MAMAVIRRAGSATEIVNKPAACRGMVRLEP
jgi:hypothetical protein